MKPWLAVLFGFAVVAGCSDEGAPLDEPEFQGAATDEAFKAFVDAERRVTVDDAQAPVFDTPLEGQALAGGTAATLRWSLPGPRARHLPPVTGEVFLVEATIPGRAGTKAILTTLREWTPDPDTWSAMRAAGAPIALRITYAYLEDNRITEGPFRPSASRTFTVTP